MNQPLTIKTFINKVLIGMSTGVIVTLVPPALMGELAKALNLTQIITISTITSKLLAIIIGVCIAMQFNLTALKAGTVVITTIIGSGSIILDNGVLKLVSGDIINASLTAALAVFAVLIIGDRFKAYTILLMPTLIITLVGSVGLLTLPYVVRITQYIGQLIILFTDLQPILMSILIAVSFAFLITSPISSVAVASAIGLTGISSGAANLGATAAGFGLAIAGFSVNGLGTAIAHVLGSPKLQMANLARKPKIILPVLALAAVLGLISGLTKIQGTPLSAGFGMVGLIGPINHLNIVGWNFNNIIVTFCVYFLAPIVLGVLFRYLFIKKWKVLSEEDYFVDYK